MTFFDLMLILSTLLCSLVAGFLFAYAIVIMPGFKRLDDKQFIKAFQVTDRVIQNNHPLFLLVWIGSAIALIIFAFYAYKSLHGVDFFLLVLATVAYIAGVQVSTIAINLPLNNNLQKLDISKMSPEDISTARVEFERRWNRSNQVRTAVACCVSLLLIVLVFRL